MAAKKKVRWALLYNEKVDLHLFTSTEGVSLSARLPKDQALCLYHLIDDAGLQKFYGGVDAEKEWVPHEQVKCTACRGFGFTKGSARGPYDQVDCAACDGTGKVVANV